MSDLPPQPSWGEPQGAEQPPPPPPEQPRRRSRWFPIALVVVVVAGVAAARVVRRDRQDALGITLEKTGRTAAVTILPLPDGLTQRKEFTCVELLRSDGKYTARIEGGEIANTSGKTLALGFELSVKSGGVLATGSRNFEMTTTQKIQSLVLATKTVPKGLEGCALELFTRQDRTAQVDAVGAAATAAGCDMETIDIASKEHIQPPARGDYTTKPPAGGKHYGTVAETGVHASEIPDELQVHNLEHGHVLLQHNGAPGGVAERLERIASLDPEWVIAAPYSSMRSQVAMTAWGVIVECAKAPSSLDDLARAFIDAFKNNAPESIPGAPSA